MPQTVSSPKGERKQVTAVFLDIVGFSTVASVADAEDLQSWLEDYYRQSREIVESFGGEVTEYLGDGVVAVFGLARADELAAAKAVNAALQAIADLADGDNGKAGYALRAGVATGEVAVRADTTRDAWPRITGMVTTLAQRVQERAEPGHVMISESTKSLLRGLFTLSEVPNQRLKGFAEVQTLYQPQLDTPQTGDGTQTIKMIGRADELARVDAADRPVLVVGEAGIGKTALARHMVQHAPRALAIHAEGVNNGSSYKPFKDWIASQLKTLTPNFDDIRRGFADLPEIDHLSMALIMGLPEGQVLLAQLSNLALKARIEASLWDAVQLHQPDGLLIFEDLHWFDTASFGVLQHIIRSAEITRYKVVLTSREDDKLTTHLTDLPFETLALHPISHDASLQLVASIVDPQTVDVDKLVERSGGVPLFLEQLTRRAARAGDPDDALPGTLIDLLAARIDDTGDAKPVLQRASAIGQVFSVDMLQSIDPAREDPLPALRDGVAAGVVSQRSDGSWAFAHALLAQAAYHSVLRKARETLHGRIVEVLQAEHPERSARDPAFLAKHQRRARQIGPAIHSYLAASQSALLQGAFADSEAHARSALSLCDEESDRAAAAELAIASQTALGSTLMQAQGFTAQPVQEAFDAVHKIAKANPSLGSNSAAALFGSFSYAILAGDKPKADGFDDLLGLMADAVANDPQADEVRLAALTTRNCACFYEGDFQSQFKQIEKIRGLYRIADHAGMITRYGMDVFAAAQMFETPARAISGEVDKVTALVAETDAHQAALSIPVMRPYALIWGAVPLFYSGRQRDALSRLRKGMTLAEEQGAFFWQVTGATWNFVMDRSKTLNEAGLAAFEANLGVQRAIGANVGLPYFSACYADRLAEAGRIEEAYRVSAQAVADVAASGLHCWYAEILRIHAVICRRHDQPEEGSAAIKLALETAQRQGASLWALRAMQEMAGDADPSDLGLPEVVAAFPEGTDMPELHWAKALL